ncbi:MAG: glycosyltransferase family 2 protein, partial [Burkholderiales bacterium]
MTTAVPISVLVLTKNEEQDLPGCLVSVAWSDDIHVYDSVSTDRTTEIAKVHGARVTQRPFDNWASHQNWGLANIGFRHPWVFYIDADERVTPALRDAMIETVGHGNGQVAFRVRRRDFFMGTWLKHVQASPFYMRLFRPEKMRYERLVNPISIPDGPVGEVPGYLDHHPFSKGLSHWLARHNSYSSLEAQQILDNRSRNETFSLWQALAAGDFHRRRFHQKELFYRL